MGIPQIIFVEGNIGTGKTTFCQNIEKLNQYNVDGTPTVCFDILLQKIYKNGTKILLENVDLTTNCDKNKYLDPLTFYNMTNLLDKYQEYWDQCDVFIIEKQMSFGKRKYNTMALKLGQHCWSYFAIKYKLMINIFKWCTNK